MSNGESLKIAKKIREEDASKRQGREYYVIISILLVVVIGIIGYFTIIVSPTTTSEGEIEIVEVEPISPPQNVRLSAGAAEYFK